MPNTAIEASEMYAVEQVQVPEELPEILKTYAGIYDSLHLFYNTLKWRLTARTLCYSTGSWSVPSKRSPRVLLLSLSSHHCLVFQRWSSVLSLMMCSPLLMSRPTIPHTNSIYSCFCDILAVHIYLKEKWFDYFAHWYYYLYNNCDGVYFLGYFSIISLFYALLSFLRHVPDTSRTFQMHHQVRLDRPSELWWQSIFWRSIWDI